MFTNVIFCFLLPILNITAPTITNYEVTTAAKMCKTVRGKKSRKCTLLKQQEEQSKKDSSNFFMASYKML